MKLYLNIAPSMFSVLLVILSEASGLSREGRVFSVWRRIPSPCGGRGGCLPVCSVECWSSGAAGSCNSQIQRWGSKLLTLTGKTVRSDSKVPGEAAEAL
jgi:hypothetical protein